MWKLTLILLIMTVVFRRLMKYSIGGMSRAELARTTIANDPPRRVVVLTTLYLISAGATVICSIIAIVKM